MVLFRFHPFEVWWFGLGQGVRPSDVSSASLSWPKGHPQRAWKKYQPFKLKFDIWPNLLKKLVIAKMRKKLFSSLLKSKTNHWSNFGVSVFHKKSFSDPVSSWRSTVRYGTTRSVSAWWYSDWPGLPLMMPAMSKTSPSETLELISAKSESTNSTGWSGSSTGGNRVASTSWIWFGYW